MKKWIILIGLLLAFGIAWHLSSLGYTYVDHRMSKRPDTGKLLWPQQYLVSAIITKNKEGYSLQNPDKTITLAIRDASIDQFADDCLGEEMDVAFTVEPQVFQGFSGVLGPQEPYFQIPCSNIVSRGNDKARHKGPS